MGLGDHYFSALHPGLRPPPPSQLVDKNKHMMYSGSDTQTFKTLAITDTAGTFIKYSSDTWHTQATAAHLQKRRGRVVVFLCCSSLSLGNTGVGRLSLERRKYCT